jgi:hypothetical protein
LKLCSIGRLVAVSVSAFLTCSAAHATDVILTGDAHVSMTRSTTNFGTLANLYVGNGNSALLQFDLSALPAGLTASQISRASLTVFVNRVNTGGTVSLSPVTSAWSESAVTYATIPTIGAPVNGFTTAIAGQYVTLDVTSLVQGWVTAPATNFGLALTSTVANVLLDSKENDETGHAASLDITITSMGAQGPQGIQGLTGAQGIQGFPGVAGATGAQGIQGPVGPTGATGAAGTIGAVTNWSSSVTYQAGQVVFCAACSTSGSSYVALATNTSQDPPTQTGVWQLIASAGATGPQGIQGIQGFQGPIGVTGAQGNTGPQGAAGATGPTGPAGPVGPIGATGSAGPAGATGTIGAVTNWSASTNYQVGQVVFCAGCSTSGSSFIALATNTGIDPPTDSTVWQMIAKVGAVGPVGAIGPTGSTGTTGATGPAGPAGPTGATGSITNGFVWSGSLSNQGLGTEFVPPLSQPNVTYPSSSQISFLAAPTACTMLSLTVNAITTNLVSPIEAETTTFTVIKNDTATSMTCAISNTTANNTTYSCSDSTHTFPVLQRDRISLRVAETLTDGAYDMVNFGTTLVCQ